MATLDFTETFAQLGFHDPDFIHYFNKQMNDEVLEKIRDEMRERYDNKRQEESKIPPSFSCDGFRGIMRSIHSIYVNGYANVTAKEKIRYMNECIEGRRRVDRMGFRAVQYA
jgi:hypothetical protein